MKRFYKQNAFLFCTVTEEDILAVYEAAVPIIYVFLLFPSLWNYGLEYKPPSVFFAFSQLGHAESP